MRRRVSAILTVCSLVCSVLLLAAWPVSYWRGMGFGYSRAFDQLPNPRAEVIHGRLLLGSRPPWLAVDRPPGWNAEVWQLSPWTPPETTFGFGGSRPMQTIWVPLWFPVLLTSVPPVIWWWRRRHRPVPGGFPVNPIPAAPVTHAVAPEPPPSHPRARCLRGVVLSLCCTVPLVAVTAMWARSERTRDIVFRSWRGGDWCLVRSDFGSVVLWHARDCPFDMPLGWLSRSIWPVWWDGRGGFVDENGWMPPGIGNDGRVVQPCWPETPGAASCWSIRYRTLAGVLAVPPIVLGAVSLRRRTRRRRRVAVGLCVRCGYDLCATPDRCPECGTVAVIPCVPPPAAPNSPT